MPEENQDDTQLNENEQLEESQDNTGNDKEGENKKEEGEGEKREEGDGQEFDDSKIEPEVRGSKKEESDDEDDDDSDPDDKARIERIVEKRVGSKLTEMENKMEVSAFVNAKPEYSKYQGAILRYMNHPAYAKIPVHNIAAIVASKDMMKLGAAKEREAQKKVSETKSVGETVRKPNGENTNWHNAPKSDFEAQKARVLGRMGS